MKFTPEELRPLTIFEGLPEKVLSWLCDHGSKVELAEGEHMFTDGHPADFLFIVVEGSIHRYQEIGGQWMVVARTGRGQVTGMLPYSRMTHYPGHAVAAEPSLVFRLDKGCFNNMLTVSHILGQRLVAEMSNRVRGDVRLEQQQEKMASLGRLSAGLAHELNNPASAISRTAASLSERFENHSAQIMKIARHDMNKRAINAIEHILHLVREHSSTELSPLKRGEREEEFTIWLEGQAIKDAWELASVFTSAGLSIDNLKQLAENVPLNILGDILAWLSGNIEVNRMMADIKISSGRVSDLVSSIKRYSHMDQSTEHKPIDVCQGLDDTLKMLGHKIKQKNITVTRNYDLNLTLVPGNAGELNQVWTSLIDNAIDAMAENGKLSIKVGSNKWGIEVKIIDNGQGIPENIRNRIFDPFFTTKGVGEGTGLGLDFARRIVQTHQGQIDVRSQPGRTEMSVRLPITPIVV